MIDHDINKMLTEYTAFSRDLFLKISKDTSSEIAKNILFKRLDIACMTNVHVKEQIMQLFISLSDKDKENVTALINLFTENQGE